MTTATNQINDFGRQLYGQLRSKEGNLFYSPYSIAVALGMTGTGAAGETKREFTRLFGDNLDDEFARIVAEVQNGNADVTLKTANALWVQNQIELLDVYRDRVQKLYGGVVEQVDYINSPGAAVDRINSWTSENTNGKIERLVNIDSISKDTRLILTNAIYFKGKWAKEFEGDDTIDADFNTESGKVKCKLMHQTARYAYAKTDDEQIIDLPYRSHDLVMTVLLPRDKPLSEYDQNPKSLFDLVKTMGTREVNVALPKFKTTAEFKLKPVLNSLGMNMAFSDHADFTNITHDEDLKISEVIHKAFVEVAEEGTEAAAATAVVMMRCMAMRPTEEPEYFRADKPFIFYIRNRKTGTVYFTGRINDPTK